LWEIKQSKHEIEIKKIKTNNNNNKRMEAKETNIGTY
jgi:hypothetical protein